MPSLNEKLRIQQIEVREFKIGHCRPKKKAKLFRMNIKWLNREHSHMASDDFWSFLTYLTKSDT